MGNILPVLQQHLDEGRDIIIADAMVPYELLEMEAIENYWHSFYMDTKRFILTEDQFEAFLLRAEKWMDPRIDVEAVKRKIHAAFKLFQGDRCSELIDMVEFLTALAFVAKVPFDDKIELMFDSWDLSFGRQLSLDNFLISLKSTICGLSKFLLPEDQPTRTPLDEDDVFAFGEFLFRNIRMDTKALQRDDRDTVSYEQFHEYFSKDKRVRQLFTHLDTSLAPSIHDVGRTDHTTADENQEFSEDLSMLEEKIDRAQSKGNEDEGPSFHDEEEWGDEFLAIKPWKGAIVPPTNPPTDLSPSAPNVSLHLGWAFGYSAQSSPHTVHYCTDSSTEIVYPAAATCVILNTKTRTQRYQLSHTDDVLCTAVHPKLPIVASGQIGKTPLIVVWETSSMAAKCTLRGFHQRAVLRLAFQSATLLISVGADDDHSVAVYESLDQWQTASLKWSTRGNKRPLTDLAVSSSTILTCGPKHIEFYNVSGRVLKSSRAILGRKGTLQLFSVATFTSGGKSEQAVVGTGDGKLYIFRGNDLQTSVQAHNGPVQALHASGSKVLSAGRDGSILVWNDTVDRIVTRLNLKDLGIYKPMIPGCSLRVRSLCLVSQKSTLLVGTQASEIYEIDMASGRSRSDGPIVTGHCRGEVWGLATHPSKHQCCTVGDDATLRVWDCESNTELMRVILDCAARACAYSSDGAMVAVGLGKDEGSSAFHAKGKRSTSGGGFSIFSATDLSLIHGPRFDARQWISDIKFSPDHRVLAVGSHDCGIYFYDVVRSFKKLRVHRKHTSYITHLDFSSDSKSLQSTCGGYELLFCDVVSGKQITNATSMRDEHWSSMTSTLGWSVQGIWPPASDGTDVNAVDRSKDGRLLATADDFGTVKLFRYPCAFETASSVSLHGHASHVTNVRWTFKDLSLITTGGNDRCVFVWRKDTKDNFDLDDDEHDASATTIAANSALDKFDAVWHAKSCLIRKANLAQGTLSDSYDVTAVEDMLQDLSMLEEKIDRAQSKGNEDEGPSFHDEEEWGDEFLAIKPWKGAIVPPTNPPTDLSPSAPNVSLHLGWAFGYSAQSSPHTVHYCTDSSTEIVYPAAATCVILNTKTRTQRYQLSHTDDVLCTAVHPKLPIVASGQIGKTPLIVVWETSSMAAKCTLRGFHQRAVLRLAFQSATLLISVGADDDHSVAVYESLDQWQTASLKWSTRGNKRPLTDLAVSSSTILTCGPKHIEFYNVSGRVLKSSRAILGRKGTLQLFSVATFTSGGKSEQAVVGTGDGKLYIFRGNDLQTSVQAHNGPVQALHASGSKVLSAGRDGSILVWNDTVDRIVTRLNLKDLGIYKPMIPGCSLRVRSLCLVSQKSTLLVGTQASEIYEIDMASGRSRSDGPIVTGHCRGEVWGLATHPSKHQCCTVGDDATLRVWDCESNTELMRVILDCAARACAYSSDGAMVAVGLGKDEGSSAFHAKGKRSTSGGGFSIFSATDLSLIHGPRFDARQWISDIKFSPDHRVLAVGSHDCGIYFYDVVRSFKKLRVHRKHTSYITHLDFSSDSKSLQSTCGGYELLFCDVVSGKQITNATSMRDEHWSSMTSTLGWSVQGIWPPASDGTDVNAVDRSKDGRLLATADDFGTVKLFRYPCAFETASSVSLHGHASHVTNVRWTFKDLSLITTGGNDRCVFVWKTR